MEKVLQEKLFHQHLQQWINFAKAANDPLSAVDASGKIRDLSQTFMDTKASRRYKAQMQQQTLPQQPPNATPM